MIIYLFLYTGSLPFREYNFKKKKKVVLLAPFMADFPDRIIGT